MRRSSMSKSIAGSGSKVYAVQSKTSSNGFPRKVQGKDVVLGSTVKSNFINTVMDLKNKNSNKSTQEQYINGLQQEIKFLQYQLKLLKDKEQFQREGVHQLDNFLKDEIPINENILAMKNKYNNTKTNLESQYKKLVQEDSEAKKVLVIQKQQINRLNGQIQNHLSQSKVRQMQFKDKMSNLSEEMTRLQSEYDHYLLDTKKKQQLMKKMNEQIQQIARQNEKQKVAEIRKNDQAMKKLFKMMTDFIDNQEEYVQSIMKVEQLAAYDDKNPLVAPLQDQNISLKKRIMINDKQKNTHENRISEIDLFLSERARDRQIQRQQKQKMLNKIFDFKTEINTIDRDIDDLVKVQMYQHKPYKIKTLINNTEDKKRQIQFFNDRLRKLEQECQNLIQDKKQLNGNLQHERQVLKQKNEKVSELNEKILRCKASIDGIKKYKQIIQKQVIPLKTQTERLTMKIPLVEKDIAKKKQQLEYMSKQVELVKQLRSIDLQEMKMVSTGASQIQNSLGNFIKKWQKIKVSNKPI